MKKQLLLLFALTLIGFILVSCTGNKESSEGVNGVNTSPVDAVTSPSVVDNGEDLVKALGPEGTWIACTLNDLVLTEDLIVEGVFSNKDKPARKIALYTQDANRKITAQFKLTAPKIIVRSENTKIQGGTFVGDIYIEANGFQIGANTTVEGNLYFSEQGFMDSFVMDVKGVLNGNKEVKKP